jgi:adenylate cyclase
MREDRPKRKLSAILSADAKGYSRLMGEDDVGTVRTITTYREVMASLIRQYGGRVVDSPGDNLLAEFGSVVDAVQCAVEIQQALKAKNAELPRNRRMEFRIGINLGDVIEEGEGIYGDGVNIAARIEGLAEAGGICISNIAFDQVKRKLELKYTYLGEHSVKNIDEPVRVYRVLTEPEAAGRVDVDQVTKPWKWRWAALAVVAVIILGVAALSIWKYRLRAPRVEPASVEKMAFALPDKPSIAVLPFDNMSDDAEQEYLADGITENITTALSYIPDMFVIARNSTFTYKGKPVKVQQVSEELGVRYVLEGSVQRAGDRVRVTAQLVDATTGHHLWAGRYDRDIRDLFALQDEITQKISIELQVELIHGEGARWGRSTPSLEAWEYGVKATSLFQRFTKENNAKARALFERAIQRDPEYAFAWTMLAWTHWIDANFGFSESPTESFERAVELAEKAVALDDDQPGIHSLLGGIHLFQRQYEKAIAEGQRSVVLGPNDATSHVLLAHTMYNVGRFEDAITLAKKAMRLAPYYPAWYLSILAQSYRMAGRYEEALAAYNQLLDRSRNGEVQPIWAHLGLAGSYMELGREREAQVHAAEVMKIDPTFSLEGWRKNSLFKDPVHLEHFFDALNKAGLK